MAIPLCIPNSDDIEDNHRLDILLEELLMTLRQVLIHRRMAAAAASTAAAISRTSSAPHVRHRHVVPGASAEVTRTAEQPEPAVEESTRVSTGAEEDQSQVQLPLPDLVMGSSPPTPPPSSSSAPASASKDREEDCLQDRVHRSPGGSWTEDGGELIRLADQLLGQVRSIACGGGGGAACRGSGRA